MSSEVILSPEEFCSQTIADINKKTKISFESNTPKIDALRRVAEIYLDDGYITKETFNMIMDPRFYRLYQNQVPTLQRLLSEKNIYVPKQGKPKIAVLCYEQDIDVYNQDISTDSEDYSDCHFISFDNKIYIEIDGKKYHIPKKSLLDLFNLIIKD